MRGKYGKDEMTPERLFCPYYPMKDEKLTPLEKNVVLALLSRPQFRRWAGLPEKGPLTLQQIADCLDVSPQTIQGIEARARLKLKEALLKEFADHEKM